jgi:hypothetical protein
MTLLVAFALLAGPAPAARRSAVVGEWEFRYQGEVCLLKLRDDGVYDFSVRVWGTVGRWEMARKTVVLKAGVVVPGRQTADQDYLILSRIQPDVLEGYWRPSNLPLNEEPPKVILRRK